MEKKRMSKVKIFWQETCPNCPQAKELGKKLAASGVAVEYHNIRDSAGLTEAVMHGVMTTPSVVIVADDDSEKAVWRGSTPKFDEVKATLASAPA